ncbi:MAG TPA: serpin family protein [Saprospiraceae bacterium]|nr:serpin family protein [Saprospiraceae bacterium]
MKNLSLFLCVALSVLLSCDKNTVSPKDPVPVEDVQAIANISGDFGWKLFQELAAGETAENVLISPLSVQTALTMAVNGAKGETLSEMLSVLGCDGCDVKDLNTQTSQLRVLMEEQSGHPRLTSANGFFYDDNRVHVLESFIQTLSTDYRAGFQTYDFGDPATVDKINAWVKENTNDKIDGIIDEIGPLDLAFLINALHFKADWATGFSDELTYPGTFFTADGGEVQVSFVSADRNFSFAQQQYFSMVDVPFRDSTYSLSFIQPNDALASEADWLEQLKSSDLKAMWSALSYSRAWVNFPKLDLAYDKELIDPLERMGMTKAFSQQEADFSNLGHALIGPVIYISKVRHKAVLKVDEKGAEGAAVTSVGFSTTSLPPTFTFNKPFVIVLRHTPTNAMLFAGLVNDPAE